jgi:hypothetical protein
MAGGLPGGGSASPPGDASGRGGPSVRGAIPGGGEVALSSELVDYLVANRGAATWLVAVPSANVAGPIQLKTGIPVLAMGGFSGADPAPTLEQLQALVRSGRLRFVMPGGSAAPGPGGARGWSGSSTSIAAWVVAACSPVDIPAAAGSGVPGGAGSVVGLGRSGVVYDCAGAAR